MPSSLFSDLPIIQPDEGFPLLADFESDTSNKKVSLGAGVYRDEDELPWILPVVKKAEDRLRKDPSTNHEYLPVEGLPSFISHARDLALGTISGCDALSIISIQTISGTGANHLGVRFVAENLKPRRVWISDQTWANHSLLWYLVGEVQQSFYPYFDPVSRGFDFAGMMTKLEKEAMAGDIIILHACAHNPTGVDPSRKQWESIADLCEKKQLFPFFDSAYQGLATGDVDDDAWAVRHFFRRGTIEMCIAQSFSKNFGLYGERVGALHLITHIPQAAVRARSQLVRLQRGEISTPPAYGAKIVATVLGDVDLRHEWEADLKTMTSRLGGMRQALYSQLINLGTPGNWEHLRLQIGMFSYSGLTKMQVDALKSRFHIFAYSSGRISIAGLTPRNIDYVAAAIDSVVREV